MGKTGDKQIRIGLLGFGNIGMGTYQLLEMNHASIIKKTGIDFKIVRILERDTERPRPVKVDKSIFTSDADDILKADDIDIVIELLGGINPASDFMLKAMENKKHVVTANKAAVAAKYPELRKAADLNNVMFRYEASVGGGIPILTPIIQELAANNFTEITGILNGTTNYILTRMEEDSKSYEEALKEAKEKGFAEADESADVLGIDVSNKLSILISLMFGKRVAPGDIPTIGITEITKDDINKAKEDGCRIKLIAKATLKDGKFDCYIRPEEIPLNHPIASVMSEFNAIFINGDGVGELMFYGKGAGPLPTGSAVLGDVLNIGTGIVKGAAFDFVVPGGEK